MAHHQSQAANSQQWPTSVNGHADNVLLANGHSSEGSSIRTNDEQYSNNEGMHGSDDQSESLPALPYWSAKRHSTCGNPTLDNVTMPEYRGSAPGKLKTHNAALVLCLNIDVDPPDVLKTSPCAVLECWVDPHTLPAHKALEAIGTNLKHQFEGLSMKIPYRPILDPYFEDLSKFCKSLRKQAKDECVLFYYNGHGVPRPTPSGELWCFNRTYTQYIPVSLMEVQNWLGAPGIYIWDCSAAGNLLTNFNIFAEKRDKEAQNQRGGIPPDQPFMSSLQLAACLAHEQLPSCPELPADIFTSSLTSPIDIALRYFIMNHQLPNNVTGDMIVQLPGDLKDRRTPLGELNWIFTAITDTIAWTTFSRDVFMRLYRSDLLIASLFRNFLLAERIMKNYHCTPHTYPSLPPTNTHPMWAAWDLAVDTCLRQLPDLLKKAGDPPPSVAIASPQPSTQESSGANKPRKLQQTAITPKPSSPAPIPASFNEKPYTYVPGRFFADQLTAFEVWITRASAQLSKRGPRSIRPLNESDNSDDPQYLYPRRPPDQLPIVLQVLLSQPHRLRALILLSQFVDLGPWAVHLVLAIGIFPYISKLLQAAGQDLRPVLIFIWARILAVDPTVQGDLVNTGGYKYFANVLNLQDDPTQHIGLPNSSEHKAMCAFILSAIARDFPNGQNAVYRERVFDNCVDRLDEGDFLLRQWSALCIGQMWDANPVIKVYGVDRGTQDKLIALLSDDAAEVRTAALYALSTFMGASGAVSLDRRGGGGSGMMDHLEERIHFRMEVAVVTGATLAIKEDASPMARKELLVLISCLVKEWRGYFVVCAWVYCEDDKRKQAVSRASSLYPEEDIASNAVHEWLEVFEDDEAVRDENRVLLLSFFTIYVVLLELTADPYVEVSVGAQTIVDYITALLVESPFTKLDSAEQDMHVFSSTDMRRSLPDMRHAHSPSIPSSSRGNRPQPTRTDTMSSITAGVASTLKRTSSLAYSLKNLATGTIAFPSANTDDDSSAGPSNFSSPVIDLSRPPSPQSNLAQYTSPYSNPTTSFKRTSMSPNISPRTSAETNMPNYNAADVMIALMEEDMERLRARRRAILPRRSENGVQDNGRHSYNAPSSPTFSSDSNGSSVILGLGTGAGIRDVLPLKSRFFDWCCEYFKEPQMRQAEADEPGSTEYNYQIWRHQRNENTLNEIKLSSQDADNCPWDRPVATLPVGSTPLSMVFHAFDHHLIVANEADTISVWDWSKRGRLIRKFNNGNPKNTSITSLHLINQEVGGIIMTGSADGVVRLFRNYDPDLSSEPLQLVSAFRGLAEMIQMPSHMGSGVVMDWKQPCGTLLIGGDSRVIRVWDAPTETMVLDLDTNTESPVTSIAADRGSSSLFIAGFGNGDVKIFDRRLEEEDAVVRSWSMHDSWVQNVKCHPTVHSQFLSAGLSGDVKLWDIRYPDRPAKTWTPTTSGLSAFDVHPTTRVFAVLSSLSSTSWRQQRLTVHTLSGKTSNPLSTLQLPTGINSYSARGPGSAFIPRHSSVAFHPLEMLYGVGKPDGTVKIFGFKR